MLRLPPQSDGLVYGSNSICKLQNNQELDTLLFGPKKGYIKETKEAIVMKNILDEV